jgi:hypothetical protein
MHFSVEIKINGLDIMDSGIAHDENSKDVT